MTDHNQITKDNIKVVRSEAPEGVARVYANHIDVNWTAFDLNILFSHIQRLSEPEATNRLEHRATVSLSWTEAKALHMVLGDILGSFEELNGELKIPKVP